jgi:hypothetical protein
VRHEIRVIEGCLTLCRALQRSHLTGAFPERELEASRTPVLPAQSGIEAKRPRFLGLGVKMNARAPFGVSVSWRFPDATRRMPGWVLAARR